MKKVIIIADLFHASPRIPGLVKYLKEFGWEPLILTPYMGKNSEKQFRAPGLLPGIRVIETRGYISSISSDEIKQKYKISNNPYIYKIGRWVYNFIDEFIYYPDSSKNWELYALELVDKIIQFEHIDAIISSSSPVTTHIIAQKIKLKYGIPWVADLRDLWSQNHNYQYGRIRHYFDEKLELRILKNADRLVTVTPVWDKELGELHGKLITTTMHANIYQNRDVSCITNGFDPDMVNKGIIPLDKFVITYTGMLYENYYGNVSKFFTALKELLSEGMFDVSRVEVRFYGPNNEFLNSEILKYNLSSIVKWYGVVSRGVSIRYQQESQVLLLFDWGDCKELGWYPLKVFEYLAAKRSILTVGGCKGTVVENLLQDVGAGNHVVEVDDIKKVLVDYYNQYKNHGCVRYKGDVEKIQKYDYRHMAESYAKLLDTLYL